MPRLPPHHFLVIALLRGKTQLDTVFYRPALCILRISRILYWFSFVESIESLCTVCVVETDRKIFNSAKNLVIVCGGVFCGDTGWWKFFWCLWRKIKPQRKNCRLKIIVIKHLGNFKMTKNMLLTKLQLTIMIYSILTTVDI